jgi:hypothetical protein
MTNNSNYAWINLEVNKSAATFTEINKNAIGKRLY